MIKIIEGIKETLISRLKNLFLVNFILAWSVTNWKITLVMLFSEKTIENKIDFIKEAPKDLWLMLIIPLILTFIYIFLLPIFNLWLNKQYKRFVSKHEDIEKNKNLKEYYKELLDVEKEKIKATEFVKEDILNDREVAKLDLQKEKNEIEEAELLILKEKNEEEQKNVNILKDKNEEEQRSREELDKKIITDNKLIKIEERKYNTNNTKEITIKLEALNKGYKDLENKNEEEQKKFIDIKKLFIDNNRILESTNNDHILRTNKKLEDLNKSLLNSKNNNISGALIEHYNYKIKETQKELEDLNILAEKYNRLHSLVDNYKIKEAQKELEDLNKSLLNNKNNNISSAYFKIVQVNRNRYFSWGLHKDNGEIVMSSTSNFKTLDSIKANIKIVQDFCSNKANYETIVLKNIDFHFLFTVNNLKIGIGETFYNNYNLNLAIDFCQINGGTQIIIEDY